MEALTITAKAAFHPKTAAMNGVLHPHASATMSTGGAAKDDSVPPIDTFTNSTPRAKYFGGSGMSRRNTNGASKIAAIVIAAGSVTSEPNRGTTANPIHALATGVGTGRIFSAIPIVDITADSTGRDPATTMMTKTNNGSVKSR